MFLNLTISLDTIRFCSYNCRGWRSGSDYVAALCDLCLIQDLNISPDFMSVGVSGIDDCELLSGHPFGGCGIDLISQVTRTYYFKAYNIFLTVWFQGRSINAPLLWTY